MPKLALVLSILALASLPALTQAGGAAAAVDVVNFAFEDAATGLPLSVASGAVLWTGVSGVHTVTADDGSFHSGTLLPGQTFSASLEPGVYPYRCVFHPSMRGIVVAS